MDNLILFTQTLVFKAKIMNLCKSGFGLITAIKSTETRSNILRWYSYITNYVIPTLANSSMLAKVGINVVYIST